MKFQLFYKLDDKINKKVDIHLPAGSLQKFQIETKI